jgi:hypothetical protein
MTTNGSFIGYLVNSKGFLCFIILHKILELLIVEFLKDVEPSRSVYPQKVLLRRNTRVDLSSFIWMMFDCTYEIDYPKPQLVLELSTHEE